MDRRPSQRTIPSKGSSIPASTPSSFHGRWSHRVTSRTATPGGAAKAVDRSDPPHPASDPAPLGPTRPRQGPEPGADDSAALDVQDVGQVCGKRRGVDLGRRGPPRAGRPARRRATGRPRPWPPRARAIPDRARTPRPTSASANARGILRLQITRRPAAARDMARTVASTRGSVTAEALRPGGRSTSRPAPRATPRRLSRSRSIRRPRTSRTLTVPTGQFSRRRPPDASTPRGSRARSAVGSHRAADPARLADEFPQLERPFRRTRGS